MEAWRNTYDAWKLSGPPEDDEDEKPDENPNYGPGNPDYEYDRWREDRDAREERRDS